MAERIEVTVPRGPVDAGQVVAATVLAHGDLARGEATVGYSCSFGIEAGPLEVVSAARAPLVHAADIGPRAWRAVVRIPSDAPPTRSFWTTWWLEVRMTGDRGGSAKQRVFLEPVRSVPTPAAHAYAQRPQRVVSGDLPAGCLQLSLDARILRVGQAVAGEIALAPPPAQPLELKRIELFIASTRGDELDELGKPLVTIAAPPGGMVHPGPAFRQRFELTVPDDADPTCDPCWEGAIEHQDVRLFSKRITPGPVPRGGDRVESGRMLIARLVRPGRFDGRRDAVGLPLFIYNGDATPVAEAPAAGWYADPWAAAPLRYWDGRAWTGKTSATG